METQKKTDKQGMKRTAIVVGVMQAARESGFTREHLSKVARGLRVGSKKANAAIAKHCKVVAL